MVVRRPFTKKVVRVMLAEETPLDVAVDVGVVVNGGCA
jgi:hypothetical protein